MGKLIIPIYSMRSHVTNKYSILKDGNFKLHINRMNHKKDFIVVPENTSDLKEFLDLGLVTKAQVILGKYGINAYESRKIFWNINNFDDLKMEIITDVTGYNGSMEFENNFNVSKTKNNPRWYIDEFFNTDLISISRAKKTSLLNLNQLEYFREFDTSSTLEVNTKVISKRYFDAVGVKPVDLPHFDIFFPSMIS